MRIVGELEGVLQLRNLGFFVDLCSFGDSTAGGGDKFRNRVKQVGIKGLAHVDFAIAYVFVGSRRAPVGRPGFDS